LKFKTASQKTGLAELARVEVAGLRYGRLNRL
jgi:hypothetical protein